MTTKPKTRKMPKPVERTTWRTGQKQRLSATYEVKTRIEGIMRSYRIKISISADTSYAYQSLATISVFRAATLDWNPVGSVAGSEPAWPKFGHSGTDAASLTTVENLLWKRGMWALGVAA